MRQLTDQEEIELEKRKAGFEQFRDERLPVLVYFAERLGFENAYEIIREPKKFLYEISEFMADQDVLDDDRIWILTRIGYFIGECLIQQFGGCWKVNEIPDSVFFSHYVVSEFRGLNNPNAMADPFGIAQEFVDTRPPRDLEKLFSEVVQELESL